MHSPLPIRSALALLLLAPGALAQGPGQAFQGFDGPAGEDQSAFRRDERAAWGRNSALSGVTHFPGTGGPGGAFDWVIRTGETLVLDTTFTTIVNADGTLTQSVVNGFVDVRHLVVEPGGSLQIRGPNAARIAVSGDLLVAGQILARGANHPGVVTFNTGGPALGAGGGPGGGRGGTGSPVALASTPQGESGYGAFDLPGLGGGGGESGFHPGSNPELRRGAGGGGGRFGADVRLIPSLCADQSRIGLDAERGGPGALTANGALGGLGFRPVAGNPGNAPFLNANSADDFFGRMVTAQGATIVGELPRPWAGAGGGAGGDACLTATFPTTPYTLASDEIGGGGGGGGGSLHIQVLGDATFVGTGSIDVSGGHGGGGENTSGINRIGGAGGGGSGGHLILEVGGEVDLSAVANPGATGGALLALGGQGGEGANGVGGANPGGAPTPAAQDSINLVPPYDPACLPGGPGALVDVVGSGGDGGPGVVQLHAPSVAAIRVPATSGVTLAGVARPLPVGVNDVADASTWDRLVPGFGPTSSSRSQWIPVAGSGPIDVVFDGTDAQGYVRTSGTGANARVLRLAPIGSGSIGGGPGVYPYVDTDLRTLVLAPAQVDPAWLATPLLVESELALRAGGVETRFDVIAAVLTGGELRLSVATSGTPLAGYGPGDPFTLRPRTFRVATDGVRDLLPGSASIRITFQGAPDAGNGSPDLSLASTFSPDANTLESVLGLAFVRFQVDFDLAADGSELTLDSPRPSLEFLRIPWVR